MKVLHLFSVVLLQLLRVFVEFPFGWNETAASFLLIVVAKQEFLMGPI